MLGFGIAGSGLLIFYYYGVLSVLIQQGVLVPGISPMGGLSGGGITSLETCAGVPLQQQFLGFKMVISYCRANYPDDLYCGGMLGYLIKEGVRQNLKTYGNPHAARQCSGNLWVSVSQLNPADSTILNPKSLTISKFTSLDDLAELAGATTFLSCFMATKPYTIFRGLPVMDGGYTSGYDNFDPPRTKAPKVIRLASYVVGPNNPTGQAGCNTAAYWPPGNGSPGYGSGRNPPPNTPWNLPNTCTYEPGTQAILAPAAPGFVAPENPDIYPGGPRYLDLDPCLWQSYSLNITALTPEVIQYIYDTGAQDAAAWLDQNNLSAGAGSG